jgi:hypothetical protein
MSLLAAASAGCTRAGNTGVIAIEGATVVDVAASALLRDHTVLVRGSRILEVAPSLGSTKEWFVVDFRPLRPFVHAGRLPTLSAQLRQSVFAFDAVLLIESGTRGTYED